MRANNDVIEFHYRTDFPECWGEGLWSAIYKKGQTNIPENYRGITILPIIEKIFEVAVYKRVCFVNEAFFKIDERMVAFFLVEGQQTIFFMISGLAQRQLLLGKCIILCFFDFNKAFDMVNLNILFYKIIKSGWYGKVTDTLRSLYTKKYFTVKHQGWLSFIIRNLIGVNQGGVASGFLSRKYLSDLDEYLNTHAGICVGDMLVAHILWVDDLVLMADSIGGMQDQLNKLSAYCAKKLLGVNEMKTRCMILGHNGNLNLKFNGKYIEKVKNYKYLGNIFRSVSRVSEDIFCDTYPFLCGQGQRAILSDSVR